MSYGVTLQGFNPKRLADIKREIQDKVRSVYGNNINLRDSSNLGQLIGIFAERESLLWELMEAVYNSAYPNTAEGVNLDNVMTITGTKRLGALQSQLDNVHLFGTPGTVVPLGTIFSVEGNENAKFQTKDAVTLVAGADEVQEIDFDTVPDEGSFRLVYRDEITSPIDFDATASEVQDALNALNKLSEVVVTGDFTAGFVVTFQGADGKIDHELLTVDSNTLETSNVAVTITVTETTPGEPQAIVDCQSTEVGEIIAEAYSLTVIDTAVTGLDSVLNTEDATPGRLVETDNEAKIRRIESLQIVGAGTVPSIRAKLLEVQDVQEATVFENTTLDDPDANGLPAKSFRAYVLGGDDQEIGEAIFTVKPAGIEADGTEVVIVVDSQGVNQTVKFSRPDVVNIYSRFDLTVDADLFPDSGEDDVKQIIFDYINSLKIGEDVIVFPRLMAELNNIAGILDVDLGIDTTPSPSLGTDDNIAIALNEIARVDDIDTDIEVNIL